jgi:membrane peptidoglycan carboxypeptidase
MDGYRTMWDGFGRSVNTYFIQLEEQVGPEQAVAMAQRLGITFRASSDARLATTSAQSWGTFTLGVSDTTPLDLAAAYATIGADGRYCQPLPVLSITDSGGAKIAAANPTCTQVVSPDVAHAAADAARCPVGEESAFGQCDGGTAQGVASILGGRPIAGKTGSSERNVTETFVGVTAQIAAAGIAADPGNPLDAVGAAVSQRVSASVASVIAAALHGQPWVDFPAPSTALAYGNSNGQPRSG